jgi:hypothetical protein
LLWCDSLFLRGFSCEERPDKGKPAAALPAIRPSGRQRPPGAKGVAIEMNNDGWRAIRLLALELETSMQKLGIEAFNDLLVKHGRAPVIVNPYGQRPFPSEMGH